MKSALESASDSLSTQFLKKEGRTNLSQSPYKERQVSILYPPEILSQVRQLLIPYNVPSKEGAAIDSMLNPDMRVPISNS